MKSISLHDRTIIRALSATSYDSWVEPPPIESLENLFKLRPRNYTTVNLEPVVEFIIKSFKSHDPLINELSKENLKILATSIGVKYRSINFMDNEAGGSGLVQLTFMELLSAYVFQVREGELKALVNESDKLFYSKYFWCFDQHSKLISDKYKKTS